MEMIQDNRLLITSPQHLYMSFPTSCALGSFAVAFSEKEDLLGSFKCVHKNSLWTIGSSQCMPRTNVRREERPGVEIMEQKKVNDTRHTKKRNREDPSESKNQ